MIENRLSLGDPKSQIIVKWISAKCSPVKYFAFPLIYDIQRYIVNVKMKYRLMIYVNILLAAHSLYFPTSMT